MLEYIYICSVIQKGDPVVDTTERFVKRIALLPKDFMPRDPLTLSREQENVWPLNPDSVQPGSYQPHTVHFLGFHIFLDKSCREVSADKVGW